MFMANIPAIIAADPFELQIKKRIAAVACEAIINGVTDVSECDGWPYAFHWQENAFPYVTVRTARQTYSFGRGTEWTYWTSATFIIRVVVAHVTQGYRGEWEALVDAVIRPVIRGFMCDPDGKYLQSEKFPGEAIYTDPETGETFAYIREQGVELQSCTGATPLQNLGTPGDPAGCEFTLDVPLEEDIGGHI
jgi:hypothetical protein